MEDDGSYTSHARMTECECHGERIRNQCFALFEVKGVWKRSGETDGRPNDNSLVIGYSNGLKI